MDPGLNPCQRPPFSQPGSWRSCPSKWDGIYTTSHLRSAFWDLGSVPEPTRIIKARNIQQISPGGDLSRPWHHEHREMQSYSLSHEQETQNSKAKGCCPNLRKPSPLENLVFSLGFLLIPPVLYGIKAMPCMALTNPLSYAQFLMQFPRTLICQLGPYIDQMDHPYPR